jgi:hypothetical protein
LQKDGNIRVREELAFVVTTDVPALEPRHCPFYDRNAIARAVAVRAHAVLKRVV